MNRQKTAGRFLPPLGPVGLRLGNRVDEIVDRKGQIYKFYKFDPCGVPLGHGRVRSFALPASVVTLAVVTPRVASESESNGARFVLPKISKI